MNDFDNRKEPRISAQFTVFIEVLASSADQQNPGNVLVSNALDFSSSGLQSVVDEDIPVDTILRICLDVKDREPIYVVGQIRWTRPDPDSGGYKVGFSLFESAGTDIERWHEAVGALAKDLEPG